MSAREALEAFQASGRDIPGPSWFDYEHPIWASIDPDAAQALGLWIGQHGLPPELLAARSMLLKMRGEDRMVEVYMLDGARPGEPGTWPVVLDGEGRPVCSGPTQGVDRPQLHAV